MSISLNTFNEICSYNSNANRNIGHIINIRKGMIAYGENPPLYLSMYKNQRDYFETKNKLK